MRTTHVLFTSRLAIDLHEPGVFLKALLGALARGIHEQSRIMFGPFLFMSLFQLSFVHYTIIATRATEPPRPTD